MVLRVDYIADGFPGILDVLRAGSLHVSVNRPRASQSASGVEEALHERERALTEAQRLAGVGSWQWEARTDTVIWSKELYHLMGIDPTCSAPLPTRSTPTYSLLKVGNGYKRAVQGAFANRNIIRA